MNWLIEQRIDLSAAPEKSAPVYELMFPGDKLAHEYVLSVYNGGEEYSTGGGSAVLYLTRYDREVVMVTGTLSGNTITFTFPQEAYAIPGPMACRACYTKGGATVTLAHRWFRVLDPGETGGTIDPGEAIPDLNDLIAMVQNMEYAVRYDSDQGLTSAQQAQARANIGFTVTDDGDGNITIS